MSDKTLLFLCSGGGGNLRFVHQAILRGWLPAWQKIAVITDRECPASEYARQHDLQVFCIDFKEDRQASLLRTALTINPEVIVTTVHKVLNEQFVAAFENKMLNTHYSLLPAFAGKIGTAPVKAAMDYGVCLGGVTVHKVTAEVDAGRPVVQVAFPMTPDDELERLMNIEFRAGCIALLNALRILANQLTPDWSGQALCIEGRTVLVSPGLPLPKELAFEDFWSALK